MKIRCMAIYERHFFDGKPECVRCGISRADVLRKKWQEQMRRNPNRDRLYRQRNPQRVSLTWKIYRANKMGDYDLAEYLRKQRENYPVNKELPQAEPILDRNERRRKSRAEFNQKNRSLGAQVRAAIITARRKADE